MEQLELEADEVSRVGVIPLVNELAVAVAERFARVVFSVT